MTSPLTPPPLEDRWLQVVDRVAATVLGPDDRSGQALEAQVAALSRVYTGREGSIDEAESLRAARLRFYLLRDLPKIEGPLVELDRAGLLPPGPRWRALDVGSGYGTTALGLARLARRAGIEAVELTAVERDGFALGAFEALAREAAEAELISPLTVRPLRADAASLDAARLSPEGADRFDLITMGLSLSEIVGAREHERARELAAEALLRDLTERLTPEGALIVMEPALRDTARALQRVRDRLAADPAGAHVAAPCFRAGPCPLLRRERDWCHAQLSLPLPPALAALAKGAGLRRSRLTYAYLALRRAAVAHPRDLWRVVGGPVRSKGKTEWDVCGAAGLVRLRRLKRDVKREPSPLDGAERGAALRLGAEVEDGGGLKVRGPEISLRGPEGDCPT